MAESGGTWEAGREGRRLDYAVPTQGSPEVLDYFRARATATLAPGGLGRLPAGRVFGSGIVLSADGTTLARDVSEDFGKADDEHWLMSFGRIRPPTTLGGATAVVAVNRGEGYAHWLLEELPRLLTLPLGEAENLVTHAANGFAREALVRRGGRERLIEPGRETHSLCAPLIVPGLVNAAGSPSPEMVALIMEFSPSSGVQSAAAGERLYFSREKAGRRRVTNEDELWALLAERGFTRVYLETLSWSEQVALCRGARVIVAAHGAGMANVVYCPPGTRVIELFNRAYVNPVFWRVAALGGLDYVPLINAGAEAIGDDPRANRFDITADLAQVRAALD